MRVRALTLEGDWTFGAGLNNYLLANAAAAQAIGTRLSMFLGDCFFATGNGIDWFNLLGSKALLTLQLSINTTILNTQSQGQNVVTMINSLSTNLDHVTRIFTASYNVSTIFGPVQGVQTINLGVGPVAPPVMNGLLPQFNQVLFNNISATPVSGAIFNPTVWWEVDLNYFIERRSSAGSYIQRGTLTVAYDFDLGQWEIDNVVLFGASGPDTGVIFTVNAGTGQVYYASDDLGGTSYVGNLIIGSGATFVAGD